MVQDDSGVPVKFFLATGREGTSAPASCSSKIPVCTNPRRPMPAHLSRWTSVYTAMPRFLPVMGSQDVTQQLQADFNNALYCYSSYYG